MADSGNDNNKGGEYSAYNDPSNNRQSQYSQQGAATYPQSGAPAGGAGASSLGIFNIKVILAAVLLLFSLIVLGTGGYLGGVDIFGFAVFTGLVGFLLTVLMLLCFLIPANMGNIPSMMGLVELYGSLFMLLCLFVVGVGAAVRASQFSVLNPTFPAIPGNAGACSAFAFLSMPLWAYFAFLAFTNLRNSGPSQPAPTSV